MKARNPYPGVSRAPDKNGKRRWRFRRKGIDCYLHGDYGSAEFIAEYEAAMKGIRPDGVTAASRLNPETLAWLMNSYRQSPGFRNTAGITQKNLRGEMEWLRGVAGDLPFKKLGVHHIEAVMARKAGRPTAANKIKKLFSRLFNYAIKMRLMDHNPARLADRYKENPDGYHTWTDAEVAQFRDRHVTGTVARLALELALNTGMARQDMARATWAQCEAGKFTYTRGKTRQGTRLPILPELWAELEDQERDTLLIFTHTGGRPYSAETFGNRFKAWCAEAGIPHCNLHGLRKAGATRLADHGATENEIAAFLAHANTRQASTYTKKADRSRLADSGMAKLAGSKPGQNLSNLPKRLDNNASKALKREDE